MNQFHIPRVVFNQQNLGSSRSHSRLLFHFSGFRDREAKGGSRPGLRFHPEPPSMSLDDFLTDREPNPGAGVFRPGVQALKNLEDAFGMPRIHSDAVILARNQI